MTFLEHVLAHALGGLLEAVVLILFFRSHKPHIVHQDGDEDTIEIR